MSETSYTYAEPLRDADGRLRTLRSWMETARRGLAFVLDDLDTWALDNRLTDEDGRTRPPYFFYSVAIERRHHDVGNGVNRNTCYPAFHHSLFMETLMDGVEIAGRADALAPAEALAEWNLGHLTPADALYGNLPYSTAHEGRPGGSVDGDSIMTDKPAIMAAAWLRLHRLTGRAVYRDAALCVADTLARTQRPDGRWPFRVNPFTGEVFEDYTSSAIYAVELLDAAHRISGEERFAGARDRALAALLQGPVRDGRWCGFYEDISREAGAENRTNYDAIDTARWLARHATPSNDRLTLALALHDWIRERFVDTDHRYGPAEAVREQLACNIRMGVHSLHWALLLLDLADATGDASYRARAAAIGDYTTYLMRDDGSIGLDPSWPEDRLGFWYSCHFGAVLGLLRLATRLGVAER